MIKKINLKKYSVINNLKELVAMSDIITLHVDYNSSSHRMMDASIFNNFKKEVYLLTLLEVRSLITMHY